MVRGLKTTSKIRVSWYDYGFRFYDPALGRFVCLDPIADKFSHVSPYNYAENNPTTGIDLWGLQFFPMNSPSTAQNHVNDQLNGPYKKQWITVSAVTWVVALVAVAVEFGLVDVAATAATVPNNDNYDTPQVEDPTPERPEPEKIEPEGGTKETYAPDRELPRDEHGNPVPDEEAKGTRHTQLGKKEGRKGTYNQSREYDENGEPVKDIDHTDHGRPNEHTNPHQHKYIPNETGGTKKRGKDEPLTNGG